jgi:hypothetical protein
MEKDHMELVYLSSAMMKRDHIYLNVHLLEMHLIIWLFRLVQDRSQLKHIWRNILNLSKIVI